MAQIVNLELEMIEKFETQLAECFARRCKLLYDALRRQRERQEDNGTLPLFSNKECFDLLVAYIRANPSMDLTIIEGEINDVPFGTNHDSETERE